MRGLEGKHCISSAAAVAICGKHAWVASVQLVTRWITKNLLTIFHIALCHKRCYSQAATNSAFVFPSTRTALCSTLSPACLVPSAGPIRLKPNSGFKETLFSRPQITRPSHAAQRRISLARPPQRRSRTSLVSCETSRWCTRSTLVLFQGTQIGSRTDTRHCACATAMNTAPLETASQQSF